MFRTYFHNEAAYAEKFHDDIYLSGDLAWQDEDGYFWYVSRADDVINTAGHLVGLFEVESALLELDEIVDVAVVGADDPDLAPANHRLCKIAPRGAMEPRAGAEMPHLRQQQGVHHRDSHRVSCHRPRSQESERKNPAPGAESRV